MEWFIAILAVVVIGLAWMAASGRLGEFGPADIDRPPWDLPEGPLSAADLDQVRFTIVPRGYAMDQVDAVIARLRGQLEDLEQDHAWDSDWES